MKRILLSEFFKDAEKYVDTQVVVCGWIRTLRDSKAFGFIELNDGSCFKSVQVVFEADKISNYDEISKLNVGSSIVVVGRLILTPQNKQPFEIKAEKIDVEGKSTPDFPLQKKRHSVEFLREIAHLRPRTNLIGAAMRVRSVAAFAIHKFFNERNFVYVHTPIITSGDCEGAGEMFRVTTLDLANLPKTKEGAVDDSKDFFGKSTGLTVSGQLNGEAYALAYGNIYTFGPTFRAEKSNTQRHAAEFWMIEPEIAFADLNDDMQLAQDMIKYVIAYVLENCKQEMEFFNSFVDNGLIERLTKLVNSEFAHITYTEAINILEKVVQYPIKQIAKNCDKIPEIILEKIDNNSDPNFGYNGRLDEFGNLIDNGIIDPTKVTIAALKNACSIATTILTTKGAVTDIIENAK